MTLKVPDGALVSPDFLAILYVLKGGWALLQIYDIFFCRQVEKFPMVRDNVACGLGDGTEKLQNVITFKPRTRQQIKIKLYQPTAMSKDRRKRNEREGKKS